MKLLIISIFFNISISSCFFKEFFFSPQILRNILENSTDKSNNTKIKDIFNKDDPEMLGKIATHYVETKLNLLLDNENININCQNYVKGIIKDAIEYRNNFEENIGNDRYTSREFVIKLALDSSKTSNELTYYDSCMEMSRLKYPKLANDYTYFVLLIDFSENKTKTRIDYLEKSYYLYAFCVPHNGNFNVCNESDYLALYNIVNGDFFNAFSPQKYKKAHAFFVNRNRNNKIDNNFIISIVIISIFGFWILLVIFRYPIYLLLKLCFRKKKILKHKKEENDDDSNVSNIANKYTIPKWLTKLNSCFSFSENFEELINIKTNTVSMSNYSGLTEIRGLTSISMFFTILGFTFLGVINCPVKSTGIYQIRKLIIHFLYLFVFIGLRFSPRIILSCNGYTLMYKYLCYIDKYINSFSAIKFIIYQSHKYFLLIFFILFFKYGLNCIFVFCNGELPIWTYFDKMIMGNKIGMHINPTNKDKNSNIGISMLNYLGYQFFYNKNSIVDKELIDYFWVPFNEIFFFFFGVTLITIGYKWKLRIDIFILVLIPLTLIGKVVFSYIIQKETYYSTLYYYLFDYGEFMTNPLFNLPYFLIGLYFGLMNYALQNGVMNQFDSSSIYSKISSFSFLSKNEDDDKEDMFQDDKEEEKDENKNINKDKVSIINNNNEINDLETSKGDEENEKLHSNINDQEKIEENEDDSINKLSKATVKNFNTEIKKFPFLKLPIDYINFRKRNSEIFILIVSFIIILAPILVHYITLNLDENNLKENTPKVYTSDKNDVYIKILNLENYINSNFVNAVFRVDIEFFVFFTQLFIFTLQIKGRNNILSFFTDIKWGIFSKSYFSFSIVCNMVILFSIYSAESIISLNIYTIYLYFIFNTILIVIYMSLNYIFFELPMKKLIKTIFYKSEDNNENDNENDDKNNNDNDNDNNNDNLEQDENDNDNDDEDKTQKNNNKNKEDDDNDYDDDDE